MTHAPIAARTIVEGSGTTARPNEIAMEPEYAEEPESKPAFENTLPYVTVDAGARVEFLANDTLVLVVPFFFRLKKANE